ncbi:hypothetical protein VQL36_16095 [Chengkuizengella sp. SCS-71B]|uniref:hypothetical protein n=1 Tax=Chengkuizengella sp. SCS-71B TaxID=3115290 RepID=UPI0032C241BB
MFYKSLLKILAYTVQENDILNYGVEKGIDVMVIRKQNYSSADTVMAISIEMETKSVKKACEVNGEEEYIMGVIITG